MDTDKNRHGAELCAVPGCTIAPDRVLPAW